MDLSPAAKRPSPRRAACCRSIPSLPSPSRAPPSQGDMRKWETNFTLSPDGGKRFGRFTEANIGNKLAVILDNNIVSVAVIESRIEDAGRIEGLRDRKTLAYLNVC